MTRWTGKPAYAQIADDYRVKILTGELPPDTPLPSESALMDEYGVSRIVARQAVGVLRNEGLIHTHTGKGSFVRSRSRMKRVAGERYRRRSSTAPFAGDAHRAGSRPDIEAASAPLAASLDVAQRLAIEPGDTVVRTTYRFLADGTPIQTSTSYEPLALTGGTPVERPEEGPLAGAGVIARMDSLGIHVDEAVETVTTRAPLPSETDALVIPTGIPVLTIERTLYAGETPVETCDIVIPGDRYALTYTIPVTDD